MEQQKPKDIKYLGVPNICFSLIKKDDKREELFSKQRVERGFDDSETWSLRDTIANFIIPRLEAYENIANDFLVRDKKLIDEIQLFLSAMKLIAKDNGACLLSDEEWEEVDKGLKTFANIFMSLWW